MWLQGIVEEQFIHFCSVNSIEHRSMWYTTYSSKAVKSENSYRIAIEEWCLFVCFVNFFNPLSRVLKNIQAQHSSMLACSANSETCYHVFDYWSSRWSVGEVPGDLSAPYIKHNLSTNLISITFTKRDC